MIPKWAVVLSGRSVWPSQSDWNVIVRGVGEGVDPGANRSEILEELRNYELAHEISVGDNTQVLIDEVENLLRTGMVTPFLKPLPREERERRRNEQIIDPCTPPPRQKPRTAEQKPRQLGPKLLVEALSEGPSAWSDKEFYDPTTNTGIVFAFDVIEIYDKHDKVFARVFPQFAQEDITDAEMGHGT